jgi:PAS domain S-box-containing protein
VDETVKSRHQPDFSPGTMTLLEKIAANLSGIIFQLLQHQDDYLCVLYVSSGCRNLLELAPEVLQADFQQLQKLIHPQDVTAFTESMTMAATTLTPWRWEGRIITPSGQLKWIQGTSQLERQANGDILWDGVLMDITSRKQAEVSLQNFAQKFSKAFSCSPDPITISTLPEGRFLEVNDSFVQLSGYEHHEAIGQTALDLNIWENESDRHRLLQALQTNKAVRNLEFAFRRKSGEVIITLLSAEIIDLDGVACILAVNHDITERKKAEAQLRLAAERDRLLTQTLVRIRSSLNLEQILQTTVTEVRQFLQVERVFIAINDANLGVRIVAESADDHYPSMLGWATHDSTYLQEVGNLLTINQQLVIEDTTKTAVSAKLQAHYQQFQTKATLAVPIMLGDELFGALITNQCSGPRHWQPGEIDLLVQISEQLAIAIQQVQLYQELAQLNTNLEQQVAERTAQLQQKMQELEEMQRVKDVVLHTVAHDLKTSVMGNLMVLQNLLKNQAVGSHHLIPVSHSIIERMTQGNDRQLEMINSLLEIHACKEQGVALHLEMVQFSALLKTVIQDLEPILSQNQATLKTLAADDLPLVMADAKRLQKVLTHLFIHSLQHNPPGLSFTLQTTIEGGMIRTQIQYKGTNISNQECDRLFNLYVPDPQAPCSTDIGLKMYLCRQVIQAHGGEIGVISHQKQGLAFWFTLPIAT